MECAHTHTHTRNKPQQNTLSETATRCGVCVCVCGVFVSVCECECSVHCIARPSGAHNVIATWNRVSGVFCEGISYKKAHKTGCADVTFSQESMQYFIKCEQRNTMTIRSHLLDATSFGKYFQPPFFVPRPCSAIRVRILSPTIFGFCCCSTVCFRYPGTQTHTQTRIEVHRRGYLSSMARKVLWSVRERKKYSNKFHQLTIER